VLAYETLADEDRRRVFDDMNVVLHPRRPRPGQAHFAAPTAWRAPQRSETGPRGTCDRRGLGAFLAVLVLGISLGGYLTHLANNGAGPVRPAPPAAPIGREVLGCQAAAGNLSGPGSTTASGATSCPYGTLPAAAGDQRRVP